MRHQLTNLMFLLCLLLAASVVRADEDSTFTAEDRSHWSLIKPKAGRLPALATETARKNAQSAVDAYLLRPLAKRGLDFAPEASRATLVRRLTLDLTGVPPTPAEVDFFVADRSPDAYQKLVERLLASPRFGEQWGQQWLDVVRYAESEGFEYDRHRPGAWRFRDYVIQSANADKPYDAFIVEQIAGDQLASTDPELTVAVGFHRLGSVRRNAGNPEVAFSRNEVLTERTNILGVAFLGLTLGCARCHDHMFDPIRQLDYYAFQAFLADTYEHNEVLADQAAQDAWQKQTDTIKERIAELKKQLDKPDADEAQIREELATLNTSLPTPLPTISTVRSEPERRSTIHLLKRGDPESPLQEVHPRFPGVLLADEDRGFSPELPGARLVLARWIASQDNPLTARVIVNRIWQHYFGSAIVATPNDFGLNGEFPSHPELLDFLASELMRKDWSLKAIHRLIVTSRAYRQAGVATSDAHPDPTNRYLSRFPRRRLRAEELRDSILVVAGVLDEEMAGASIMVPVEQELVDLLYHPAQWQVTSDSSQHRRRSIYLVAKRNLRLPFLDVFDQPDLQTSCARRESSTHAPQALELLNGPFTSVMAEHFAHRLQREAGKDPSEQVALAFQLAAGRNANTREAELSLEFLERHSLQEFCLAMFSLNSFLYVE